MIADFVSMLSFTGMRSATLEAVTTPTLTTPKGKTADGRYPWDNGQGFNTTRVGIVKRATVRGIVGADWEALVADQRLREGIVNESGEATYNADSPRNGTVWMLDANGNRLAFKRNADGSRFYLPVVVTASMGYEYFTMDGVKVERDTVNAFLRDRSNEGRRQGVASPLVYRDYGMESVASLRIGERVMEGDALRLYNALRDGDSATVASIVG